MIMTHSQRHIVKQQEEVTVKTAAEYHNNQARIVLINTSRNLYKGIHVNLFRFDSFASRSCPKFLSMTIVSSVKNSGNFFYSGCFFVRVKVHEYPPKILLQKFCCLSTHEDLILKTVFQSSDFFSEKWCRRHKCPKNWRVAKSQKSENDDLN